MNKLYLSYDDIEKHVQSILRDITHTRLQSDWRPDYIVGLTRGGLHPANLISQYMNVPMYSLDVSLRDNLGPEGPESNLWMAEDAISGKNILIVDDINDSGATLSWIVNDWYNSVSGLSPDWEKVWGHNVRTAFIVNNEASDFETVNYSGLEINKAENDVWIVFPWEDWWTSKP